jgi:methyl-accepting chemotaxis protein
MISGEPIGRRLGTALLAFGLVGLVLTTVMAIAWFGGWMAMEGTDRRLEASRVATASALADAGRLLGSTSGVLESTTASFDDLATALEDTSSLLARVSDSTGELAAAMDINILGQRPFAGVGGSFGEMSRELGTVSDDAGELATTLGQNEPQLQRVAADLRTIQASITGLAIRVEHFTGLEETIGMARGYALLSGLLALWLALLAGGCVWLGLRLRRVDDAVDEPA